LSNKLSNKLSNNFSPKPGRTLVPSFTLLVCILLAGCATAPVQEMSDARQAIRAAVDAGAVQFAPYELQTARQLLEEAEERLDEHAYQDAERLARNARDAAKRARNSARARASE
jgi:hypothetical protein